MNYAQRTNSEPHYWNDFIEQATGRAFDWRCPFCSADLKAVGYIRAHISPVGTGVGFVPGNIVLSCNDCNVSMGDNHAWLWCVAQGINHGWILTTLEILQKVFSVEISEPIELRPVEMISKRFHSPRCTPNEKSLLVTQWFREHPEDKALPGRELEATRFPEGVKISYATWNKGK